VNTLKMGISLIYNYLSLLLYHCMTSKYDVKYDARDSNMIWGIRLRKIVFLKIYD